MKNMTDLDLTLDSSKEQKMAEFSERLETLKSKIEKLREVNKSYFELQKESKELAKEFISDFKDNKVELGKIVS
jgi:nicotinic acid mononucleotide adenylyltransferase